MKKTFIKPEAHTLAMQTENMILAGSDQTVTQGKGPATSNIAEAKRGASVGAISATTFAWN